MSHRTQLGALEHVSLSCPAYAFNVEHGSAPVELGRENPTLHDLTHNLYSFLSDFVEH